MRRKELHKSENKGSKTPLLFSEKIFSEMSSEVSREIFEWNFRRAENLFRFDYSSVSSKLNKFNILKVFILV